MAKGEGMCGENSLKDIVSYAKIKNKRFMKTAEAAEPSGAERRGYMVKRFFVRTRSLKNGMKIDQKIVDKMGRTLIARDTVLDDFMIDSLSRLGVAGIYIREGEEDPEDIDVAPETLEKIEKLKVADRAKVSLSESVKQRVAEGVQYLYNNTASEGFTDATNNIANDLMRAITENHAIAVDISALKTSDEYTFKHSVDVATMAMIIAKKHGLGEKEIYDIGISGLLHDVGKSKIPHDVLNKPGRLSDIEFALMKQHTLFGYAILKDKEEIAPAIAMGVLQHHEKLDGKGYPLGLAAEKINPYAKFLSVADIYDALVTERPYKAAFSQRDAIEMIMSMTNELDIDVMRSFLGSVILYPVGCTVQLSNGERARVVRNDPQYILRPKVVGLKTGKVYNLAEDLNCASVIIM